jgi:hypothetical protein
MAKTLFDAVKETDNATYTENGMAAYKSSLNKVLDLFAKGASHRKSSNTIPMMVRDAYAEDKLSTVRCLFYLRDVRGGQGEREVFRKGIREVAEIDTTTFINSNLISHIPTYGRWDDLFCLFGIHDELDKQIIQFIVEQLKSDITNYKSDKPISIMAKWLPSVNASSKRTRRYGKMLCKELGITEKTYRKTLSMLRKRINILETYLTNKDYTFDYNEVPSNANMKYRKCFHEKDGERYRAHIDAVSKAIERGDTNCKEAKVNVKTLYPYEIVNKFFDYSLHKSDEKQLDNMWRSLPDYFGDAAHKNWLAVVDTSGSMTWGDNPKPIGVAISLGMYVAEHNKGVFKNKFITFESNPHLIEFDDKWGIKKKVQHIASADWGGSTNLIATFELVLNAAKKHKLPAEEMPEAIVIISDMQFDACVYGGNNEAAYDRIRTMYSCAGYRVPKLVFWNAALRDYGNLPVTQHQYGAVLVGGCKPGMFEQILSGKTPADFMLQVLNGERYSAITLAE